MFRQRKSTHRIQVLSKSGQVNTQKSAVARPWQRSFLGFTVTDEPQPRRRIAGKAVARFKHRVRDLTRRQRGISPERMIAGLNPLLRG